MTWFWLNVPLMAVSFLAMTLIPLRMVLRHPGAPQEAATAPAQDATRQPRPVLAPVHATTGWAQAARETAVIPPRQPGRPRRSSLNSPLAARH